MAAAFSNSEHNYPYLDSAGYPHLAPSSYEVQDPNFYAQKSSEFHYQPTYDEIQYSSLIQESGSINSEHHRLYEDSLALESQFACRPDYVDDVPQSVFSWPVEYFVAPAGADFVSESFLLSPSTPDLVHSPASTGSLDESFGNVFDMQFGTVIGCQPSYQPHASGSGSESASSSPTLDSWPPIRSSRPSSTNRTPSPPSDSGSSSHSDHRRRFPCLLAGCSRRFTSQYTLKVHMEAHKPKPKVSFLCTLGCSERFSRQHDRLRHEVAKHGKICEFSCDDCGRFFSTSKTLGNHRCPVAQGSTRWVHSQ
ncbi:uncharacterized protein C8R40DRAFT_1098552 [Lentinula edodes]|uniref:uncharacterized protein n=1 Tax=Lentinula edodes TaxID=5353 RepID=UPI001E8EA7CC|nr:uncharacterized protein C8R40DRAFT_1098552 [Lentinula edodes]KAH7876752.1 hypothetical protein C8R40DRAFT_1098552 [Lentinula edodes]